MKDHRLLQQEKARRENRELLAENITFEQAQTGAKEKRYPVGSVWHWATGCVWGPIGSAKKEDRNAA